MHFKIILIALASLGCLCSMVSAEENKPTVMEPAAMADMALVDEMKTTDDVKPLAKDEHEMMMTKTEEKNDTPVRTVGDFIIHPLVAFRARQATEADKPAGRQADTVSSTTSAPWPVIGLGYGQVIGSQVSNLAGQISGWLNDRIQLPGLVDTLAPNTTTTTTTPRPDVIVRVQHRPAISINANRPAPINANANAQNQDYEQDENDFGEEEEDEYEGEGFEEDEEDEEEEIVKPVGQRRPVRRQQIRPQRIQPQQQQQLQANRRPINRRRPQFNRYDDYAEDDSDDEFYYGEQESAKPDQQQIDQQHLINQIRLLTRGKTPAQIGDALRKTNPDRQQGTFLVRRNGQTVFLAPELIEEQVEQTASDPFQVLAQSLNSAQSGQYPAPPLSKPLKKNGKIQQYITIPYNQLGIMPPQAASGIAEGIQSQPLILSIPHSALQKLQSGQKQDRPLITPNAVPLLTEANFADLFKPPQIPPSRTEDDKPQHGEYTPIYVYTQGAKPRPESVVEKAPSSLNIKQVKTEEAYIILSDDQEEAGRQATKPSDANSRFYKLPKGGRFAVRNGRTIDQSHSPAKEELIAVKIVEDKAEPMMEAEQKPNVMEAVQIIADKVEDLMETEQKPNDEIQIMEAVPAEAPAVEIKAMTETEKHETETILEKKDDEPKL